MNQFPVFDHPWVLAGLGVLILLFLFNQLSALNKRIHKNLPQKLRAKLIYSRIFSGVFFACLIIALAGPRWGKVQAVSEYRRAVDAVIAVDVSRSMEVPDGMDNGITRLERGLAIARETVMATPGIRFAAALGRNRGITAVPLTWDNSTILTFLESLDGTSMTGRGTNLESLIDAAAGVFQGSHLSNRVIILVSDGETLTGSFKAAIGRCGQAGIVIAAVAVGSDEGGTFPGGDGIVSMRDTAVLRTAAAQTGGVFIDGNREDAAETLIRYLRAAAPEIKTGGSKTELRSRWFLFVMLSIIAFGMSKLSVLKMRNKINFVSLILILFLCGCSGIQGKLLIMQANFLNSQGKYAGAISSYMKGLEHEEAMPYAEYGLGTVYYAMGEDKAAMDRFTAAGNILNTQPAAANRELRYRIHYNTGVLEFSEGNFSGAADSFRQALRTDSGKIEAKRNLELSLLSLERDRPSGSGDGAGNDGENESRIILNEFIRQKELNRWKSLEWQEDEDYSGPDY